MLKQSLRILPWLVLMLLIAGCGSGATPMSVPPMDDMGAQAVPTAPPPESTLPPTAKPSPTMDASIAGDTWVKTYGGDHNAVSGDMLQTDDGGYLIVGTANLQWEPEQLGDVYLIRTDPAGEVLWEKTYDRAGYSMGQGIARADDGTLLISGVTSSSGDAQDLDGFLLNVDQEGNELWYKTYGGPLDEYLGGLAPAAGGGYILGGISVDPDDFIADPGAAGYGGLEGRSNLYVVRVDDEGNELWSRRYESENNIMGSGAACTEDGGFLVLAAITYFPDPDDDILLLKLDADGNEVWSRLWEEGKSNPHDLIQTSDGNYLISASYAPLEGAEESKEDFYFIKVDPQGKEIWSTIFGEPDMIDYGVVLAEAADGGFVAVGERTRDHRTRETDIVIAKIDENGNLLWDRSTPASHTMFSSMQRHPDDGFVVLGGMFMGSRFEILLAKTDSEGNVEE